ncbi:IclR family transcriptional regulator domain-containing protein [Rhodoferax bucti]|uniref:IclR family transcriptional regulator domain-containing protein n=1 Tax=Rhodoferax bucti TaxID=2576305 RepID=UPI001107EE57|nr:IclR family transcriptional regulator C-terminal domain-containing protein [Rhodoferax bucti]
MAWLQDGREAPPIAATDLIAGMAKGMAVLESFDTERQKLNATLAAQRAGITRAAARRHLLTLAHLGYLESDGSYFWLSSKILRFSGTYLASARFPRAVQPTLNRLAAQTQESFSAVVLDGDEVVIVARSGNDWRSSATGKVQVLAYGLHLGARLPAHATSTGRVLLAGLAKPALQQWLTTHTLRRLTAHTVTDTKALKGLIDAARKNDFSLAVQEHELGVQALAVPLRNAQGVVVGALNVVAAPHRWEAEDFVRTLLPVLQDAAQELRALV